VYVGIETTDLRSAGESLYGVIVHVNTTHETRACPPPPRDAGPADAGHDAGPPDDAGSDGSVVPPASTSCGCRSGSGSTGGMWSLLVIAALAVRRTRT
jgi:MYXO-CTERM domain-containing protein